MDQEVYRKVHPRDFLKRFVDDGIRPDGRALSAPRRLSLQCGHIATSIGSAMIKMGRTKVVAGVHARLIRPSHVAEDQGILDVSVDVLSLASLKQRPDRQEMSTHLKEYITDLVVPRVDLSALCIESELLVWRLILSVYCIDNDGNLEDATLMASMSALLNAKLPTVTLTNSTDHNTLDVDNEILADADVQVVDDTDGSILALVTEQRFHHIAIDFFPIPVSFALFDGKALLDPSAEEEQVSESRITFIFRPSGELIFAIKPGGLHLLHHLYESGLKVARARVPQIVQTFREDMQAMNPQ